MKKILLLPALLALAVLTGCDRTGTMMLSTEDEAVIYRWTGKGALEIRVSEEDSTVLTGISGKGLSESLGEIFRPDVSDEISREDWDRRESMLDLLSRETGSDDHVDVLSVHGKEIQDTEFMEIMDGLSGRFDDRALAKMLRRRGGARKYSLGAVLSSDSSWPETVSFVTEWTEQISHKENIR